MILKRLRLILLFPFGLIYGAVAHLRRLMYRKKIVTAYKPPIPTICIGNIAVGGTGKTPHVEYLVHLLRNEFRIAILSRGYKRKTRGYLDTDTSETNADALMLGDEPMQYHTHFPDIKVAVCENRAVGIRQIINQNDKIEAVILDDAFQHLAVQCGLNIIITEFARPFCKDFPLPAGNLREFGTACADADMLVISKSPENLTVKESHLFINRFHAIKNKPIFFTTYRYGTPFALTEKANQIPLSSKPAVMLLTGIANPQPLFERISKDYTIVQHIQFPDHHYFTTSELSLLVQKYQAFAPENVVVFTTEKDACRLLTEESKKIVSLLPIFAVPIKVEFLFEKEQMFNKIIQDYVRKNQGKCSIS